MNSQHGFLVAAIIERAITEKRNFVDSEPRRIMDYRPARANARKMGYANVEQELDAFFESEWLDELCEMIGMNPIPPIHLKAQRRQSPRVAFGTFQSW